MNFVVRADSWKELFAAIDYARSVGVFSESDSVQLKLDVSVSSEKKEEEVLGNE